MHELSNVVSLREPGNLLLLVLLDVSFQIICDSRVKYARRASEDIYVVKPFGDRAEVSHTL